MMRDGWRPWASALATNAAILAAVGLMIWLVGLYAFLLVHLPIVLLAASIGVWLFYVQHQFERTRWARNENWDLQAAALHGSSYYDLPAVLRWFTANIGMHHVHHLCSRIPDYRLPQRDARSPGPARREPGDLASEFARRAPDALGREASPSCIVQGHRIIEACTSD